MFEEQYSTKKGKCNKHERKEKFWTYDDSKPFTADFNGEFDIELGGDRAVHAFEAEYLRRIEASRCKEHVVGAVEDVPADVDLVEK